ncbi:MAG: class I SAM-dependent methyltransferase [Gemmatimonadaceae bacterium]
MPLPGKGAPADEAVAHNVRAHDAVAATYDAAHSEIFNPIEQERLAQAVRDVLAVCARGADRLRVVDVGAGTGNLTGHFLACGASVVSADVSPGSLRVAAERFATTGRHAIQQIDGRTLAPFADASFDVAACYSVLHHVPDYLALVDEMARVVRPGGVVYIEHERHDASWQDPLREQFMREAWVFPPRRLTRFVNPRNYWRRLRPLLQWRRWLDPRWMPEGDLHIWPDDHIEWAEIEAGLLRRGVTAVLVRDYLLYDTHLDRAVWERWKDRITDHRMWVGRKT